MTKFITLLYFFSILLIYSCHEPIVADNPNSNPVFISFEMSYTDGWAGSFTFYVDSSRIFFAPKYSDSVLYGVVADSIFALVNSSVKQIINGKEDIKDKDDGCIDCDDIAVETVIGRDTLRFRQTGELSEAFDRLVRPLQVYIGDNKHRSLRSYMFFNTYTQLHPVTKFSE